MRAGRLGLPPALAGPGDSWKRHEPEGIPSLARRASYPFSDLPGAQSQNPRFGG
jgi:hypothetical protein